MKNYHPFYSQEDLQVRGLEEVLLVVSDGITGMTDAIHAVYPEVRHQTCCVHVSRTLARNVRGQDRAAVCADFKTVYRANSREEAAQARHQLEDMFQRQG